MTAEDDGQRDALRGVYFETWRAMKNGTPLQPLQNLVAGVIARHPEYHPLLDDPAHAATVDFPVDSAMGNPFLHLGMHMALIEQIQLDQPRGVRNILHSLQQTSTAPHQAEHLMMGVLERVLSAAQRTGQPANEAEYLRGLQALVKNG